MELTEKYLVVEQGVKEPEDVTRLPDGEAISVTLTVLDEFDSEEKANDFVSDQKEDWYGVVEVIAEAEK